MEENRTEKNTINLELLARLAAEATPGPWTAQPGDDWNGDGVLSGDQWVTTHTHLRDAEFIAAADPETVAALVRIAREARGVREAEKDGAKWIAAEKRSHLDEALAAVRGDGR